MTATVNISEEELVGLLSKKDRKGMSILYDNYSGALYGVICKVLADEELAQDTLQEVFVKIWQRFDNYDTSKGKLFTWMLNIARNAAIDVTRSKNFKKDAKTNSTDKSVYDGNEPSETPKIDHIGLKEILKTLKPEHKEIIDLIYFNGYTQAETAEELGIPLGTVKTRVKLAMKHLREVVTLIILLLWN